MTQQPDQPRQSAWMVDYDLADPEKVVELARDFKSDSILGSPGNVTMNINGSPSGININGDPEEAASDLNSVSDSRYITAAFQAHFPQSENIKANFNLNIPLRQITFTVNNAKEDASEKLLSIVQSRFPRAPDPTDEEQTSLSLRLVSLIREAEKATEESEKAAKAAESSSKHDESASNFLKKIEEASKRAQTGMEEVSRHQEEVARHAAEIGNAKAQVQADQETVRTSREGIGSIEATVRQFFDEISNNRTKIVESEKVARETAETSRNDTEKIVKTNQELQEEIRQHLQKAVGASLFSAFQRRKDQLSNSKWIWAALTAIAIVAQAGIFVWLAQTAQEVAPDQAFYHRPAFLLRALASVPIIFFIAYSIRQYARERDFEELYSFKSALSFSLAPYLDLVRELSERPETEQYRDFVVRSIGQIFENPLSDGIERPRKGRRDDAVARDVMERFLDMIERSKK